MFVSFVDTTDFYNQLLLLYLLIWFVLLSFALHSGSGAYRPGYLGIVALASCTYYGLSFKPSRNLATGQRTHVACVRWSILRSQNAPKPSAIPTVEVEGVIWLWISCRAKCYLVDLHQSLAADPGMLGPPSAPLQMLTGVNSSPHGDRLWMEAF